jgi:hypothetical protein
MELSPEVRIPAPCSWFCAAPGQVGRGQVLQDRTVLLGECLPGSYSMGHIKALDLENAIARAAKPKFSPSGEPFCRMSEPASGSRDSTEIKLFRGLD